jgi:hypothetical protein
LRYTEVGVPPLESLGTAREAAGFARPALLRLDAFVSPLGAAPELVSTLRLRYADVGVPRLASVGTARDAAGLARPALLRAEPEASPGAAREPVGLARPALPWLRYVELVVGPALERGGASAVYARPS